MGRAEGDGAQHEAPVLERHTTRFRAGRQPGPLTAPVLGRSGCPTERAGRSQGRPLFQRGDVCCLQQQTGEFCADPFLRYRQCGSCRQARALDATLLRLARHRERKVEGGKLRQQRLRASSARGGKEKALHRGLCGATRRGSDLRAGEKVRERAGVAGARARRISRPGDSTGLFEQQVPVKSVFAQTR